MPTCTSPNCTNEIAPTSKYQCRSCLDAYNEKNKLMRPNRKEAEAKRKKYWMDKGLCAYCSEHRPRAIRGDRILRRCEECNRKLLDETIKKNKYDPVYNAKYRERMNRAKRRGNAGLTNGCNFKTSREHIVPRQFFVDLGMPFEAADESWNIRDGVDFRDNSAKGMKLTDEALALIKEHGLPLRADWKERYGYLPE